MMRWQLLLGFLGLAFVAQQADAGLLGRERFRRVNMKLHGQVLDFTNNHGCDNRLWSPALCQRRDVYVYLPPGYTPEKKYPLGIFLHGATQDEQFFLEQPLELFDKAIACGELPPVVLVAPDGSIMGRPSLFNSASWWANSRAGNFEDYLMHDVWNFVMENFSIHPEREAHALFGVSMGGCGAYAHAMKYKDRIKICAGFMPALNLRWVDCHGRYNSRFDPDCWGWREEASPLEIIGRPGWGLLKIRYCNLFGPACGRFGAESIAELSRINPIEIMERVNLQDKELDLYVAYGGKDEFSMDAQVDSFLYLAKQRGVTVAVDFDPQGRHDVTSGVRQFAAALRWVGPLVARYDGKLQVSP
jgi:S-formylglutathione hydrolase FrmB